MADFSVELGLRYNKSEGVIYGPCGGGEIWEDPSQPTSSPGSRAPHFWMDNEQQTSIHDLFSRSDYTLLIPSASEQWHQIGKSLEFKFPLKTVVVSHPHFCKLYKIEESGCILVRPDGVIAWKGLGPQTNECRDELQKVLRRIMFTD